MLENTDLVFQVFQLTALIVRGPMTCGGRVIMNLDRVMICEDEVHSAIHCVHDFIRSPHFTQRSFFSDSGIAMLAESAASSDRITHSAVFEPWSHVETTSRSQVVADMCGCVSEALDRRRLVKDSQEQWYAVGGIRPSSEDSTSRSGVKISNVVEEGWVEYVPVRVPSCISPGPNNLRVSSGKSKERTIGRSPVKRRLEIPSPPPASQQHRIVEDLSFSATLDHQQSCKKSRRSERKRRAAPVFQGGLPWLICRLQLRALLCTLFCCYWFSTPLWNYFASFNCMLIFMQSLSPVKIRKKKKNDE